METILRHDLDDDLQLQIEEAWARVARAMRGRRRSAAAIERKRRDLLRQFNSAEFQDAAVAVLAMMALAAIEAKA